MSKYIVDQETADRLLSGLIEENSTFPERVNAMMKPTYIGCDTIEQTVTIEFTSQPWEANRKGQLHGGIVCTMLDHTVGLTAAVLTGAWAPMADFSVSFLRPGTIGDTFIATGKIMQTGKRIIFITGEIVSKESGKLIATCSATYMNNAS